MAEGLEVHTRIDGLKLSKERGSDGKESACSSGDSGSIPESRRSLEKGMATHSSPLAWRIPQTEARRLVATVYGVAELEESLSESLGVSFSER